MRVEVCGNRRVTDQIQICMVCFLSIMILLSIWGTVWAGENQVPTGAKILSVSVRGNANVPTQEILQVVQVKAGDKVSEEKIRADLQRINDLGYFSGVTAYFPPKEGGVDLIYEVAEHPKLAALKFEGNKVIPTDQLELLMSVRQGEVLNVRKLNGDLERILKYYYNKGYSARIADVVMNEAGELGIKIVEMKVAAVKIEGNVKTKEKVIRRELSVKPGDILDINKIREDQRRVYNLGIFETVDTKLDLDKARDAYTVTYVVKERRTGTAALGVAYSSSEGFMGYIDVGEENFLGNHQKLNLRWEFGAGKNMYEIGFFEPWLDANRTSLGFNLYNRSAQREGNWNSDLYTYTGETPPSKVKYTELRRGGDITLGRPLGPNTRGYVTLRVDGADLDLLTEGVDWKTNPNGETRSIKLAVTNDTRDNFMNPTGGSLRSASAEFAGGILGGTNNFTKYRADGSTYIKVGSSNQVVALHLGLGFSGGQLPPQEQFVLGGSETVRGYRYNYDSGDKMIYANAEYRFPITKGLQGVIFTDTGSAWNRKEPIKLDDFYTGSGVGIRIDTPIGLIRIDYGLGKEGGQTYFSFGQMF